MATVALLRGINVGGHRKVPMADLRAALDAAGLGPVATYVQSGNIVLPAPATAATGAAVQAVLADRFGLTDVPVLLRSHDDLVRVLDRNPFSAEAAVDAASVHVVFLDTEPVGGAALDPQRSPGDRFHLEGAHLWVHYPNGSGRSKLDLAYIERTLGVGGTARNVRTVTRLADMAAAHVA